MMKQMAIMIGITVSLLAACGPTVAFPQLQGPTPALRAVRSSALLSLRCGQAAVSRRQALAAGVGVLLSGQVYTCSCIHVYEYDIYTCACIFYVCWCFCVHSERLFLCVQALIGNPQAAAAEGPLRIASDGMGLIKPLFMAEASLQAAVSVYENMSSV